MEPAVTFVMAGGEGTRLQPLTVDQAKPAVGFGPGACLLDLTLLNCLRSGIAKVEVLAQYRADSVAERILTGWRPLEKRGAITIFLRVPEGPQGIYLGTADAVRKNLHLVPRNSKAPVLVLAGDHVYDMDYRELLRYHEACGGHVTVGATPVPLVEAHRFGVLITDSSGRVVCFREKPKSLSDLVALRDRRAGVATVKASMGIYVFRADVLRKTLSEDPDSLIDFGRDVLPRLVTHARVFAYPFADRSGCGLYWRDVGTVQAYYQAQMDLVGPRPRFEIRVPFKITGSRLGAWRRDSSTGSLVALSSRVEGKIFESVVAPGAVVEKGATVERAVLLEGAVVEAGAYVEGVVLGRGARIGAETVVSGTSTTASGAALPPEGGLSEKRSVAGTAFGGVVPLVRRKNAPPEAGKLPVVPPLKISSQDSRVQPAG